MAYTTVQYRQEFVAAFEERTTWLRGTAVTEAMVSGNTATFLVSGSNNGTAVTRGVEGLIPASYPTNTQYSATLAEAHRLERMTKFDIFQAQGNQIRVIQMNAMAVINREIDRVIIAALDTATQDTGAATTASIALVMKAKTILGNAEIPTQEVENMFGVITPAFEAYLEQTTEYSSADYVETKPFAGPTLRTRRWSGINWIVHPNLTGVGTAAEKCYVFHRNALGHAIDKNGIDAAIGTDDEQQYSWARASVFHGAVVLQNSGIVQILHDGSAYVAS